MKRTYEEKARKCEENKGNTKKCEERESKCEVAKINHYKTAEKRPNRRYLWVRGGRPWEVENRTLAGDLLQNTRSEEGILKVQGPESAG